MHAVVQFWLHIPCLREVSLCEVMLSSVVGLLGQLKGISKSRAVSREQWQSSAAAVGVLNGEIQ